MMLLTVYAACCLCCVYEALTAAWARLEAARLPYGPTNPDEPPAAVNPDPTPA